MQYAHLLSLIMINLISVIWDFRHKRIPNFLVIIGWILGFIYQVVLYGLDGILPYLLGVLTPIVILLILFVFQMLGSGDIKLLSVIGGFLGARIVVVCIIISFIVGGIFSAIKIFYSKNLLIRLQYLANYFKKFLKQGKIESYYREEEGDGNIVHFSLSILIALVICLGVYI